MMDLARPAPRRRLLLVALGAGVDPGVNSGHGAVPAVRCHDPSRFVDSVGVCTHLDSARYRSQPGLAELLSALGVRHIRDDVRPQSDWARWRGVCARAGVRAQLLASPALHTVAELLASVDALGRSRVSAVEGQNEGDGPWFLAQAAARPGWARAVIDFQRALFEALTARYGVQRPLLVSPTVLDYRPADMQALCPAAPFCDVVALHAYPQAQQEPETHDDYAGLGWYRREMAAPFKPGAPVMITETGYSQFGTRAISSRALACYLPRLLLHAFSAGVVRTYLYELLDEGADPGDSEQGFGLITAAGERKPAFRAIATLMAALGEVAPARPGWLALRVDGPTDLRCVVFAGQRGLLTLALWRAVRSWENGQDIVVPAVTAAVRLPWRAERAAVCALEEGAWRPGVTRLGSIEVAVADSVVLVRTPIGNSLP